MYATGTTRSAEAFRARHVMPPLLLLPNAWDAMSARASTDNARFAWITTTSVGVAWSLGYADGEIAPWPEVVAATARIVRAARCPISADIEAGYGATPTALADHAKEIIETGIIGLNIEDGTPCREVPIGDLDEQCTRIAAIRPRRNLSAFRLSSTPGLIHICAGSAMSRRVLPKRSNGPKPILRPALIVFIPSPLPIWKQLAAW
jgi:2-methylisocitrate lyase-like PEP mutase family enzyme